MYLYLLDQEQLLNARESIKTKISPGWDKIKLKIIKYLYEDMVKPLAF